VCSFYKFFGLKNSSKSTISDLEDIGIVSDWGSMGFSSIPSNRITGARYPAERDRLAPRGERSSLPGSGGAEKPDKFHNTDRRPSFYSDRPNTTTTTTQARKWE
jgi:hypothetical protein